MDQDEIVSSLLTALIINQVRRFLDTKNRLPDWDMWLSRYWIIVGAAVAFSAVISEDFPLRLIWLISLAMVAYTVWLQKENQPARTLLLGVAPFMVLQTIRKIIEDVFPRFYARYDDYFDSAIGFTLIWLFTFYIFANRQKKALVKIEQQREEEAAERRIIEARKTELEVLVAARTAEIMNQKAELERALSDLKATQNQLVHSEKMASLGELTAGIAHEIQNPLNFVNNFSEVSVELVEELEEEQQKPDRDAGLEAELLADLKQNLQKINHHGGRASSIVKGMLQHSRAGSGQREPTDLNGFVDEYLRLAYHGLRAKDKTFNASFSTDLDPDLGLITVVPQDIGRVLLNLFTNAFYAVQQRSHLLTEQQPTRKYTPTVTVKTRCQNGQAVIQIADNGVGIPDELQQKIFQPFFTTKPTGQGTGLGLSLAFDIVTQGHGGTITVDSRENEGTTFVITLPA
ncbi:ATP-binding protein [Spirosoma rigui]|uniref:ATP-binding protein n=1 Tax=Spirosoma rigui TaxID=564064 RepID=UPI0009B13A8C|nr:ATP-binding protein [Spirosoma rigui]